MTRFSLVLCLALLTSVSSLRAQPPGNSPQFGPPSGRPIFRTPGNQPPVREPAATSSSSSSATCTCHQTPMFPIGGGVWAWVSYIYQGTCDSYTTTLVITYDLFGPYPRAFCSPTECVDCIVSPSSSIASRGFALEQPQEPGFLHDISKSPASPSLPHDLTENGDVNLVRTVVETRFLRLQGNLRGRWAKVFLIELTDRQSENARAPHRFWYGFEVTKPSRADIRNSEGIIAMNADPIAPKRIRSSFNGSSTLTKNFVVIRKEGREYLLRLRF